MTPASKPHSELRLRLEARAFAMNQAIPGAVGDRRQVLADDRDLLFEAASLLGQLEAAQREVAEWRDDAELKQGEEVSRLRAAIERELHYTHGVDTIDRLRAALYPGERPS